jgi:hypothetical protein
VAIRTESSESPIAAQYSRTTIVCHFRETRLSMGDGKQQLKQYSEATADFGALLLWLVRYQPMLFDDPD